MKKLALTLVILAMTTTAYAGGNRTSLFQCGVRMGGTNTAYRANSGSKKDAGIVKRYVAGPVNSGAVRTTTSTTRVKPDDTGRRMAPVLTIARLGCSWR